jgi:DNA-binding CsgD family transcriptional regulator
MTQLASAAGSASDPLLKSTPRWVGAYAERVIAARADPTQLQRVFDRSSVPMLIVDGDRRYIDANRPARLAFRQTLADLHRLRIDDLTPEYFLPKMEAAWARLIGTGCMAGRYDVGSPVGTHMDVIYYALANVLPGLHLIAFAPAGWPEDELLIDIDLPSVGPVSRLTPRELEVLDLAAEGVTGPVIAQQLILSSATVRSHFANIYTKLGVHDRAAAVAKAMRMGLID